MSKSLRTLTFGIMLLVSVTFIIYAYIKAKEANRMKAEVDELNLYIEDLRAQAEALTQDALNATAAARMAEADALRAVEECQSKLNK